MTRTFTGELVAGREKGDLRRSPGVQGATDQRPAGVAGIGVSVPVLVVSPAGL